MATLPAWRRLNRFDLFQKSSVNTSNQWSRKNVMVQCKRIGHVTLETPDVEGLADYYEQVIGLRAIARTKDEVFFATRVGQLALRVRKASAARCSAMSFEVSPNTDLSELRSVFSK